MTKIVIYDSDVSTRVFFYIC